MGQATLKKTQFVLNFQGGEGEEMTFTRRVDPGEPPERGRVNKIDLPRSQWVEFGQPDVITVTIEPGDRLNEEAA